MKLSGSNIKKFLKVFYILGNGNPIELLIFPERELFLYIRKGISRTLT